MICTEYHHSVNNESNESAIASQKLLIGVALLGFVHTAAHTHLIGHRKIDEGDK